MKKLSLIGCGRWGTFLGWYAANYCGFDVDMYDIPTSPNFIELQKKPLFILKRQYASA